jgi:hypothetical protein
LGVWDNETQSAEAFISGGELDLASKFVQEEIKRICPIIQTSVGLRPERNIILSNIYHSWAARHIPTKKTSFKYSHMAVSLRP